jgi:hypothetical protein
VCDACSSLGFVSFYNRKKQEKESTFDDFQFMCKKHQRTYPITFEEITSHSFWPQIEIYESSESAESGFNLKKQLTLITQKKWLTNFRNVINAKQMKQKLFAKNAILSCAKSVICMHTRNKKRNFTRE